MNDRKLCGAVWVLGMFSFVAESGRIYRVAKAGVHYSFADREGGIEKEGF
jgi:hypothetical protein